MDGIALTSTAAHLRAIPEKSIPATDKLRLAWQLLADAFRHPHLKDARYARLRDFVTPTYHMRYSEPLAFLGFAAVMAGNGDAYGDAVNSTGFRDEICDRAILAVADWIESIAHRIDEEHDAGYLGLSVDEVSGEVRRQGRPDAARFEAESAEWHMFLCAWRAGAPGATQDSMADAYPGDPAPYARKAVKQHANRALAVLGVRLAANKPPTLEIIPE